MKRPHETISFVCVIYKHPIDMIQRMVDSIDLVMQYCPFFEYEIILLDNDASDNKHLEYEKLSESVHAYSSETNIGYCGGNNKAVEYSGNDYIIVINPDVILTDSLAIDWMVGTCKMHNCISGKLVGTQQWYTYTSSFPTDKQYNPMELPFFFSEPTLNKPGAWKPFRYIDGCLFCIPKSVWNDIDGFDEDIFPGYFGENVLCFKAFLKGYDIKDCNIGKCFTHAGNVKSPQMVQMVMNWSKIGRQLFYSKYALPNWDQFLEYLSK